MALISDANTPGPVRHIPLDWQVNSIEAYAWALCGDVWHGRELFPMAVDEFRKYDLVMVNMNETLWPMVAELTAEGVNVWALQEGPSDLIGTLDPGKAEAYIRALKAANGVFLYDPRALTMFSLVNPNTHYLPLPAPMDVYDQYRKPREERPSNPPHLMISQPIDTCRGAAEGLLATRLVPAPLHIVVAARTIAGAALAVKLGTTETHEVEVFQWSDWKPKPRRNPRHPRRRQGDLPATEGSPPPSFLERLAECRLAINMDSELCYGRFVVDCAGLGVPCVGTRGTLAQECLFPWATQIPSTNVTDVNGLLVGLEFYQVQRDQALRELGDTHTPTHTRKAFEEATKLCLDS